MTNDFIHRMFLCGPQYAHGDLVSLSEIDELAGETDLLETLSAVGVDTFSRNTENVEGMAVSAIGKCLDRCELTAGDVDAIVYASTLYFNGANCYDPVGPSSLMADIVRQAGLVKAAPYGVSFTQCVNIVSAIEMARGLILSGMKNVLVLTADAIGDGMTRIVEPGVSIVSDVASCVLVSDRAHGKRSFAVGSICKSVDWDLLDVKPNENFPEYLRRTVAGMKSVASRIYEADACLATDMEQLITNTVNHSVVRIFSQATGIPPSKVFRKNVSRFGHCDAADIVVNLSDFSAEPECVPGSRLLVIANGPFLWGGMSLVAV